MSATHTTDCLVGGGGPGGMFLALLLARQGVRVTLLEAHHDFDRDFRGRVRWPAHVYKLYILCERVAGEPVADGLETEEAAFVALDALPHLSLKTPPEQLERALAVALDPTLPAALD